MPSNNDSLYQYGNNNENVDPRISRVIKTLRLPLMIMVVFIHCTLVGNETKGIFSEVEKLFSYIIPSVAVPLFMFIAAYLYFAKMREPNYEFWMTQYRKRFKSLIIPYVLWNSLVILGFYCIHKFLPSIINPQFENVQSYSLCRLLRCYWDGSDGFPIAYQFWFIRDLIVFDIFTPALYLLLKRKSIAAIYIIALSACVFFNIGGGWLTTLLYFSIGIYVALHNINFTSVGKKGRFVLAICSLIGIFLWMNGYESKPFKICYILITSELLLSSSFLLKKSKFTQLNDKFSDTAFFIFAFHGMLALILCKIINVRFHSSNELLWCLIYFINIIFIVGICIAAYYILKRYCSKLLSILTGGR